MQAMASPKEAAPPPRPPQPPSLKTIEAALKLIDSKKESLKKAYDDLQSHSSLLSSSSFSLSWPDLDSHFTSLQTHVNHRFHFLLQSFEPSPDTQNRTPTAGDCRVNPVPAGDEVGSSSQTIKSGSIGHPLANNARSSAERVDLAVNRVGLDDPSVSDRKLYDSLGSSNPASNPSVVVRPELVSLCEKMDGMGLRNYVNEHWKERVKLRVELMGAMRAAPDSGAMVLEAMEGFYSSNLRDLQKIRRVCSALLEVLMELRPNLSDEVRERARNLALDWKKRVTLTWDSSLEALCFLLLVVAYGLQKEFDVVELGDYFFVVARFQPALELYRAFDLGDKAADVIQKLIDKGMQLLAVKFILEMGLIDKFQPVSLLKAHLKECKMFTKKVCRDKNSSTKDQNEARSKECNAVRAVLKIVEDYKLQSEYPPLDLKKRLRMLDSQKADAKHPAQATGSVPPLKRSEKRKLRDKKRSKMRLNQPQQQNGNQQNGNKRPRTVAPTGPAAIILSSSNPSYQHSFAQPARLLPPSGPYGLVGSSLPVAPFASSSAGPYGFAGAATGYPGNPSPVVAHPSYSSEPPMPSGYYNGLVAYGGYNLPHQYHQTYYPM